MVTTYISERPVWIAVFCGTIEDPQKVVVFRNLSRPQYSQLLILLQEANLNHVWMEMPDPSRPRHLLLFRRLSFWMNLQARDRDIIARLDPIHRDKGVSEESAGQK